MREIKLDGGEISMLKALGLSGTPLSGTQLLEKVGGDMESGEFIDTLSGLLNQGYLLSSKVTVQKMEDAERAFFRVNPSYARDLRDALRPGHRREEDSEGRKRRRRV